MPGTVVRIPIDMVEVFPIGTVVTRASNGVLAASFPVSKPGERERLRRIAGEPGEDIHQLADRVRAAFHRSPESLP